MVILNTDRELTAGASLKTICPLQSTKLFSLLLYLDDDVKSYIAMLAMSLTKIRSTHNIFFVC